MRPGLLLVLLLAPLAGCAVPGLAPPALPDAFSCTAFEPIPAIAPVAPTLPTPLPTLPRLPVAPPSAASLPAVERDEWGVPIIRGETSGDIWRQIGYAMAQDRLWQLEHKRLAQQGRLSEVFGPPLLEADVATRERRLPPETVHGALASLEPDTRATLDAYVDGINLRLDEVARDPTKRPAELVAFAWTPAPWTPADVVEVMLQDSPLGTEGLALDVAYALLDALPEDEALRAFNDIVPHGATPGLPTSIPQDLLRYPDRTLPAAWSPTQLAALREARPLFAPGGAAARVLDEAYVAPLGGSNAVAVAPSRSASGGALLLGGPQVGYETPAVYWEARVETQGAIWDVFIKPGEGLPRGHLGAASFVLTTGYGDQHDLVLLRLDPADPERYRYGADTRPFAVREEVFLVADRTKAPAVEAPPAPQVERRTMRTSHLGAVLAHDPQAGWALAEQRFAVAGQVAYLDAFLDEGLPAASADAAAMRARIAALAEQVGESTNILVAYADGVIELRHTGRHVVRPGGQDARLPRLGEPASEPTERWGPSCIPIVQDPPQGYIANWNNAPARGWPDIAPRPWMWGASHRVQALDHHLREALEAGPLDADGLNAAMERAAKRDEYAWLVLPDLLRRMDDARAAPLRAWLEAGTPLADDDGDGDVDHPGVAAYEGWRVALQEELFGDELGEANKIPSWGKDLVGSNYDDHGISFWTEGPLRALLRGDAQRDWWDDVRTPERETPEAVLARTLDDIHPVERPMSQILYRRTGLGPDLAMPQVNRGSINYVVDHGTGAVGTVTTPGQSGHVEALGRAPSPHASDQLELFQRFGYKPR